MFLATNVTVPDYNRSNRSLININVLAGFFDDYDRSLAFTVPGDKCVEIARTGPDWFRIVRYGKLQTLSDRYHAVLTDIIQGRGRAVDELTRCPHVALLSIANEILPKLPNLPRHPATSDALAVHNDVIGFFK
jgi:hypothetical protein